MRAAVIQRPGQITIIDAPAPEPGPRDVQVRLAGSGVCGSNLPVFEGRPWFTYPLPPGAPGHEGWGRVERVGSQVSTVSCGAKVALLSQRAFAELDVADEAQVVPLPQALDGVPFPAEAIACAVNVIHRAQVLAGQRVAVVGVGFLGAVLVRLAWIAGADVTAVSRRRSALDIAAALGARATVPLRDTWETVAAAKAANRDREFDVVIEATGLQAALDISTYLTTTRGRLVIAGYHQDGPRQIDLQVWNWRGIDVVNAHERDPQAYVSGMREAVRLAASGALPVESLVTHVFSIEEAHDAFRHAVTRPDGFLKAVVVTPEAHA